MFIGKTLLYTILSLAILSLFLLFLQIRKKKRGNYDLKKDSTGLWRYHEETVFERKHAYDKKLGGKKEKKDSKGVAVVSFHGDMKAKQHKPFASLVDEIVVNKDEFEEVVVIIQSPGGVVAPYGHAFSQMERIRNAGLNLTACVDVVAASGGYLMALPANKILAAPHAMVGSVGVMAFVPNFRNLLKDWNINPRTFTAGKHKNSIHFTDDAGQEEIEHFKEQLSTVHEQFLSAVKKYRSEVNLELVQTGDHWSAADSVDKNLGLVDELMTSEEYLLERNREKSLYLLSQKKGFFEDGFASFGRSCLSYVEERLFARTSGLA